MCGRSKNVGMPIAMLLHADGIGETQACKIIDGNKSLYYYLVPTVYDGFELYYEMMCSDFVFF